LRRGVKLQIVILLVLILALGYVFARVIKEPKQEVVTEEIIRYKEVNNTELEEVVKNQEKIIKEQTKALEQISKELNSYKVKEKEEEIKRQKILSLQRPEIIQKELAKVGKIIGLEGIEEYEDIRVKKSLFGRNELSLLIVFTYGFGVELDEIIIDSYIDDTVILQIPKRAVELKYIKIDTEKSNIEEVQKWLGTKEFTSQEVKDEIFNAQNEVENILRRNIELRDKAMQGVKDSLEKIILRLGYSKVVFEEI